MRRVVVLCGVVLASAGCVGALGENVDAGVTTGSGSCVGVAPAPRPDFYDGLFGADSAASCAAAGCHGGPSAGGLTFSTAADFARATVGVRSVSQPTRLLVAPGSLDESVLYQRLLASASSRMPVGGPFLTESELAQVAGWICGGALPPASGDGGAGGGGGSATGGGGGATGGGGGGSALSLTGLTPMQVLVGSATTLTLTGAGFTSSSTVHLDAEVLATTFTSAQQLTALLGAGSTTSARVASVTVVDGPASTSGLSLTIANPAPTLSALTPSQAPLNSAALTLTLTGSGFNASSTATFDGAATAVTLISPTTLTVQVPTLTVARAYPVVVSNPAPGGGSSTSLSLTAVALSGPVVTGLSPNPTLENAAISLTVSGGGFSCSGQSSVVLLNGATLTPSGCTATQLVVAAPALAAGSYPVSVRNGAGGTPSAAVLLDVIAPNPVPTLTSLTPASAASGQAGFTVTLSGTGFVSGAVATWNGAARPTTVVSATQATASVSSADVASAGTAQVGVTNPAPGGGASNTLSFTIAQSNPVPTVSALSPCGAVAGAAGFSLSITGAGFSSGSTVTLNGVALSVTGQTATSLVVTVPSSAIATAPASNTLPVVVSNPAPGGGASAPFGFGLASAAVTLGANVQPFFAATCATMGCHTANSMSVPMALSSASVSYANLVGQPCTQCPPRLRVKACDPTTAGSYLLAKVKNVDVCMGTRMPKAQPLTAGEVQMLVNWVAQGAPP